MSRGDYRVSPIPRQKYQEELANTMDANDLLQALNGLVKGTAHHATALPDIEIHYAEWKWKGCTVRRFLEEGDFWVLLPGFSFWLQVSLGEQDD